jgi:radical SAM protein with 4Fe4S-binding SPASM domain
VWTHPNPQVLSLQWHITARCNLRCAHCYQEDYGQRESDFSDLLDVVDQFGDLLDWMARDDPSLSSPMQGQITVTGGEPFLREDLLDLLEVLAAKREQFTFSVLTNGTFIDAAVAQQLSELGPAYVQVSLEGSRTANDMIRGPGAFDRTVAALRHLVRAGIRTAISFTAHRGNRREFGAVARLGRDLGVTLVWADRLIPWGSGLALREEPLTPDETRRFFETMYNARTEAQSSFCQTQIATHRALQFLVGGGHPYRCPAGDTLMAVEPNGDLSPCRRMPIRVGNLFETPLVDLYAGSELLRALRDRNRVAAGCEQCRHARTCGGGLRCLAYALTGDPFVADPGCWHARSEGERDAEAGTPTICVDHREHAAVRTWAGT